ncbi:hypothetical protein COCOBI_13-4760 [Coccomyxa sp. Obi]|nr:hypothetical protein COCOBI_13-4760 [Coccomyxa sp. Obi]
MQPRSNGYKHQSRQNRKQMDAQSVTLPGAVSREFIHLDNSVVAFFTHLHASTLHQLLPEYIQDILVQQGVTLEVKATGSQGSLESTHLGSRFDTVYSSASAGALMAAVLTPNGTGTHITGTAALPGAQESPQAQKTAELLAAWHSLAPTIRDQPVPLHQPIPAASGPQKTGLAASDSSAAVDPSQAAQRVQALLEEWRSSAGMHQEASAAQLSWNERLQHQISKQQGEDLLAKVASLEYGH